jgi:AbiV family abortive infection protein
MKNGSPDYWLDCDFLSGACFSFENGKNHLLLSESAATMKLYGFAVSNIVLATEELIKALVLVGLNGDRAFISTVEINKIFRDHSFKHLNIEEFLLSLTGYSIAEYEYNWQYYFLNPGKGLNKFQSTAFFLSKALKLGELTEDEADMLSELIKAANYLKNRGFYVDYHDNWRVPEDTECLQFEKYKSLADKLLQFISPIFTMPLTDERIRLFLYGE